MKKLDEQKQFKKKKRWWQAENGQETTIISLKKYIEMEGRV